MLRGRALNVLPQYSKEAEDCLSKAVKLDPKLAEAWSYLGECYWKNNQVELARNCFVGSLNHVICLIAVVFTLFALFFLVYKLPYLYYNYNCDICRESFEMVGRMLIWHQERQL